MTVTATLKVVLRELPETHEHDGMVSMTLENEPKGVPKGITLWQAIFSQAQKSAVPDSAL